MTAIMREGFPMTIKQSSNWGAAFGYDHQRPNLTGATKPTSGSTADRVDNYINNGRVRVRARLLDRRRTHSRTAICVALGSSTGICRSRR